jgi:hypothetical protein
MSKTKGRFRDFGKTQTLEDYEPLGFALNGEEFTCKPAIAGAVLLDFVRRADAASGGMAAEAIVEFLEDSLESDEDKERFMAMIRDPDVVVQVDVLGTIAGWLIEQFTARPTKPRSRAQGGRTSIGRGTTDISLEEE